MILRVLILLGLLAGGAQAKLGYDRIIVLSIGVSEYVHGKSQAAGCETDRGVWCHLPNAEVDAETFQGALQTGQWQTTPEVTLLTGARTTKAAILDALDVALLKAQGNGRTRNLFVFYFTGHGKTKGKNGYLIPRDGHPGRSRTWIGMRSLREKFDEYPNVQHQLVLLGSCFGGALLRGDDIPKRAELLKYPTWRTAERIKTALARMARVAITAGDEKQSILDGPPGKGSRFGNAMSDAFVDREGTGHMGADANRDGCVTHTELASWAEDKGFSAPSLKHRGNDPVMGYLSDHRSGKVLLCRLRGAPTPASPPALAATSVWRAHGLAGKVITLHIPSLAKKVKPVEPKGGPATVRKPVTLHIPPVKEKSPPRPDNFGHLRHLINDQRQPATAFRPALHVVDDRVKARNQFLGDRAFFMMRTEVTQAQWKAVMGTRPSYFRGDNLPVERVSWYDAVAYANALSVREGRTACYKMTGCKGTVGGGCGSRSHACMGGHVCAVSSELFCTGYRLPTIPEWEHASCLKSASNPHGPLESVGWLDDSSRGKTHPVGRKGANVWGLHDMFGNVEEWMAENQMARGGSWQTSAFLIDAAIQPTFHRAWRSRTQGFRLVR